MFEVAILCLAVAAGVAFVVWQRASGSVLRSRLRHRVVVTTKAGATFSGVLWQADPRCIVLREAQAIVNPDTDQHAPADGEVLILAADIAYLQKP